MRRLSKCHGNARLLQAFFTLFSTTRTAHILSSREQTPLVRYLFIGRRFVLINERLSSGRLLPSAEKLKHEAIAWLFDDLSDSFSFALNGIQVGFMWFYGGFDMQEVLGVVGCGGYKSWMGCVRGKGLRNWLWSRMFGNVDVKSDLLAENGEIIVCCESNGEKWLI